MQTGTDKYHRPKRRSHHRFSQRMDTTRDMSDTKPPYKGDVAFRMGWPCVPPYQMKWRKKSRWRSAWWWAADFTIESGTSVED